MLTQWIAIAIGVYSIAAGIGLFIDRRRISALLDGLRDNPALAYITGVLVYAVGVILLLAHYRWEGWLESLVTLIGWIAVIEGLVILASPGPSIGWARRLVGAGSARAWGVVSVVIGLVFLIGGIAGVGG